jgi:hypothetical protein
VCEAQETLNWFSQQTCFGVLKLASAFSTTCCQLVIKHISFATALCSTNVHSRQVMT